MRQKQFLQVIFMMISQSKQTAAEAAAEPEAEEAMAIKCLPHFRRRVFFCCQGCQLCQVASAKINRKLHKLSHTERVCQSQSIFPPSFPSVCDVIDSIDSSSIFTQDRLILKRFFNTFQGVIIACNTHPQELYNNYTNLENYL